MCFLFFFFFQAEDGIRDGTVTGVQTCALPISAIRRGRRPVKLPMGAIGVIGGIVGVATAGLTVAGVVQARRRQQAREEPPETREPLGHFAPTRTSTVAADDGVPLSVEEVDPNDGGRAELTVVLVHGFALDRRSWHFRRRDLADS